MNKLKKTEGFTLVELIVVIAILGILAAVAVPAYSGYITKAHEAADTQIIAAVNTAIDAATATGEAEVDTASYASSTITVTFKASATGDAAAATKAASDYAMYMSGNSTALQYYNGVSYTGGVLKGTKS